MGWLTMKISKNDKNDTIPDAIELFGYLICGKTHDSKGGGQRSLKRTANKLILTAQITKNNL